MTLGPVMLGIPGPRLGADDRELLAHPATGGVILFDRNYRDPCQLAELAAEIHALREPRLLIAVDQEGGRVQRFRSQFTRLPAPACFGALYDDDREAAARLTRDCGWLMAAELRACGVDFSFAPALDLRTRESVVIGDRALHRDAEVVAILARAFMTGMGSAGMCAVGKHFPGHGSVEGDSHHTLPVDDRDLETLRVADMLVFERMIHYGLPAVLAAHVVYPKVDTRPAGYSRAWLQRVLRGELGFTGAVFSDDLGMAGASLAGGATAQAALALDAGCDMVLLCNDRAAAESVIEDNPHGESALRSARLARMHGRDAKSWQELRADPRHRDIAATIGALDRAPELDLGDEAPI
ncbi:MAG: beta-N-acetylhexosaminidase [Gammaproteobacteria bacterium]